MIRKYIKSCLQSFVNGFYDGLDNKMMKTMTNEQWKEYVQMRAKYDTMRAMKLDALRPCGVFPEEINPYVM